MTDKNPPKPVKNNHEKSRNIQNVPAPQNPIVQPAYINQKAPAYAPMHEVPVVPQPTQYITPLDPVFVDHLGRHQGQHLVVMTTAGKVEGVLKGVAVDHIQLNISEVKAVHIRIAQIVFFEGYPISYR
jgi:hypothetical protein